MKDLYTAAYYDQFFVFVGALLKAEYATLISAGLSVVINFALLFVNHAKFKYKFRFKIIEQK